ncbi:hypothetical protein [Actinomadura sp. SCN-SB]|uniref:hypothetical protein n=1 Tax=Actinomadura sp. SCN-SB TaxID=3373092 RepID=UPI00375220E2
MSATWMDTGDMTAVSVGERQSVGDVFASVLDEIVRTVPYSSAASFHQFFGAGAPPWAMGRGCGWQAFELARQVEEQCGVSPTYLVSGGHVPAFYIDGEGVTVLDPYLPHVTPLRLDRSRESDGIVRVEVDAYPIRVRPDGSPAPSRLRGTWWVREGSFALEYLRYGPRRGDYAAYRAYTFQPASMVPSTPIPEGLMRKVLASPMQNNLSIRTVHRDDRQMREIVLPLTGRPRERLVDRGCLISKDNQGAVSPIGHPGFDRNLEFIADTVGVAPEEVVEFVMDAAALCHRIAPLDRVWPDYSVEDE